MTRLLALGSALSLLGLLACSDAGTNDTRETTPPSSPGGAQPPGPRAPRAPLTDATVDAFIAFVLDSTAGDIGYIREQLTAAQGSETIASAFLDRIEGNWRFVDGKHLTSDPTVLPLFFQLVKGLRATSTAARVDALVWRPLPSPAPAPDGYPDERTQLEMLEASAVEALVCVEGQEAEVDRIIASHPSSSIREAAADQRSHQWCAFMQTANRP